jgi:hypothetical protein
MVVTVRMEGREDVGFPPPPFVLTVKKSTIIWCLALSVDAHVDGNRAVTAFEPTMTMTTMTTKMTSTTPSSGGRGRGLDNAPPQTTTMMATVAVVGCCCQHVPQD